MATSYDGTHGPRLSEICHSSLLRLLTIHILYPHTSSNFGSHTLKCLATGTANINISCHFSEATGRHSSDEVSVAPLIYEGAFA